MIELEKVITGLTCCDAESDLCDGCPYQTEEWDTVCINRLKEDALALLKEMDRTITVLEHELKYARGVRNK